MANDLYRPPMAKVADPPDETLLRNAPRAVRIAIVLSWLVLATETTSAISQILTDVEASADSQFKASWLVVTLTEAAISALFIFQASQRRNWGRFALLFWTLGLWCFWIFWPPLEIDLDDYPWWEELFSGALIATQLVAVLLLFRGAGAKWYSSAAAG
jgi:hypothetical protein